MTRVRATDLNVPQCYQCGALYTSLKESPATCTQCGATPFLDWRFYGGASKTATVLNVQRLIE